MPTVYDFVGAAPGGAAADMTIVMPRRIMSMPCGYLRARIRSISIDIVGCAVLGALFGRVDRAPP